MKVANANINYAAKSYNPNLLASVPPNSQVKEQQTQPSKEVLVGKGNIKFKLPSCNNFFAKRTKKLQQRKSNKVQKQMHLMEQLTQHEKLLSIIDSQTAQRDGIFKSTTCWDPM